MRPLNVRIGIHFGLAARPGGLGLRPRDGDVRVGVRFGLGAWPGDLRLRPCEGHGAAGIRLGPAVQACQGRDRPPLLKEGDQGQGPDDLEQHPQDAGQGAGAVRPRERHHQCGSEPNLRLGRLALGR